jgi:hypothetical protein
MKFGRPNSTSGRFVDAFKLFGQHVQIGVADSERL